MVAYVFPGQASQFVGMAKDLYQESAIARRMLDEANDILGFEITRIMFEGPEEDLKQTQVTQPAVFLHSVIKAKLAGSDFRPDVVAGHSLGEISALVANDTLSFSDGLNLVKARAEAMQHACEQNPGTMAAVIGLDNKIIEDICASIDDIVIPANYNCPGQLVISGSLTGIEKAVEALKTAGARRALPIAVGGAFHSPLMKLAEDELSEAIDGTNFAAPDVPIYQNVTAQPESDPDIIAENLKKQLTAPVRWTQTMLNMIQNGVTSFVEVGGNGKVLSGFVKKIDRAIPTNAL